MKRDETGATVDLCASRCVSWRCRRLFNLLGWQQPQRPRREPGPHPHHWHQSWEERFLHAGRRRVGRGARGWFFHVGTRNGFIGSLGKRSSLLPSMNHIFFSVQCHEKRASGRRAPQRRQSSPFPRRCANGALSQCCLAGLSSSRLKWHWQWQCSSACGRCDCAATPLGTRTSGCRRWRKKLSAPGTMTFET